MSATDTPEPEPIRFPTNEEVAAQIEAERADQERAERLAPTFDEIAAAIDQLNGSDRGKKCLRRFNSMLKELGMGLDRHNWRALATLHRAGAANQHRLILQIQEAGR